MDYEKTSFCELAMQKRVSFKRRLFFDVKAIDHPVMDALCRASHTLAQTQPFAGSDIGYVTDNRRQKDAINPDNGTRPPPPEYICHSLHIVGRT
jgi:hypothetical protein